MGEKEVVITYETLFELLRKEKSRDELQKLDANFFRDTVAYLSEKTRIFEGYQTKLDLFSMNEKSKAEKQLFNAKNIIKELYDRREKKIINMAMDKTRITSGIIDASALLNEEKELYNALIEGLTAFRRGILFRLLENKMPGFDDMPMITAKPEFDEFKSFRIEKKDKIENAVEAEENDEDGEAEQTAGCEQYSEGINGEPVAAKEAEQENHANEQKTKLIRFIHAVPKFVGEDLQEYGPFEEKDTANLPIELANILINKNRAEMINL